MHDHSIVMGDNLISREPYHLLIDCYGVKIDKIMTHDEYEIISKIIEDFEYFPEIFEVLYKSKIK